MRIFLAILAMVLCMSLLSLLLYLKTRQRKKIVNRMEYFSGTGRGQLFADQKKTEKNAVKGQFMKFVRSSARTLRSVQTKNDMDLRMQQADWPLLGSEYEVILLIAGAVTGIVTLALTLKPLMALAGVAGGVILGMIYLNIHISRRQTAFVNQLGDMLVMVANALRAGFSFMQAFELIAREMDEPIGREIQKVLTEVNVGADLETALDNMQKRVQSPDFELVVTAVLVQRQVGGNLAQILDTISETINERIRMRREVMALTAQGRLSGIVLAVLPIGLAAALSVLNPEYLKPLIQEDLGKMAVAGAVVLEIIGFLVIRKIVDIKV